MQTTKIQTEASILQKTVMDSGVRVITERFDNVRSAAVGAWFLAGARDETPELNGISHFLEHMMFKGTDKRSPLQIAREIEQVGGHLNAFTSKEVTAYYAHLLDERLPLAVDVLTDIVSHSKFIDKELERERGVVLEEIAAAEDAPDDVVHEDFTSLLFPDHSLGRPILGTREKVSSFGRDTVMDYWSTRYSADRCIISAAGRVDHDKLVRMVEKKLELKNTSAPERVVFDQRAPKAETHIRKKDIVQAHLVLGMRGYTFHDERRFPFFILNTVLGSGMSSRLFQSVRERNGLAYSIYSFHEAYGDTGLFGIYAGTEEKQVGKAEKLIRKEMKKMADKPLSKAELNRAKTQLKGALMLGLENVSTRMSRLARNEAFLSKFVTIDELLGYIDEVTFEKVQEVANDLFSQEPSIALVLPQGKN